MISGRGAAPVLVYQLVQGLPDTSLTSALASGGKEHFGWGVDRHMQADVYDALNANTRATGNWGKSGAPKIPARWRPTSKPVKADTVKPKATVASIYAQLSRR